MAGKEVDPKKAANLEEGKDSFSVILDKAQEVRLSGHPAAEPGETDDQLLERQLREKAEKAAEEGKEKVATPAPGEEESEEEKQRKAEEAKKAARKPKFETVEEADRALQEAESKMHKATTEAAETKKLLTSLQDQMNTLLVAQLEGKKEKEKAELELQTKQTADAHKKAIKEMLKVVRSLDPEAEDYDDKYADAMGQVFNFMKSDLEAKITETEKKIKDSIPSSKNDDLRNAAIRLAKAAGLDMNPEVSLDDDGNPVPSADYDLFFDVVGNAPGKDLKEQVQNAVKKVNRIKKGYQDPLIKAKKGNGGGEIPAGEREILERSGGAPIERLPKDIKPMSLDDSLKEVQRRRTI